MALLVDAGEYCLKNHTFVVAEECSTEKDSLVFVEEHCPKKDSLLLIVVAGGGYLDLEACYIWLEQE